MLQQTQTERVVAKYREFMSSFPTIRELASASLLDILKVWQGLGYNRRARFLHQAAQMVCKEYNAILPETEEELVKLPGIGKATASAICAYAYDLPVVYIETNIRALFIHFFFQDRTDVQDKEILPLVEATLDRKNPRKWYSALMDLGTEIKKRYPNPSRRSKHHTTQSKFKGSRRELRGQVIRNLVANPLGLAIDEFEISETFDYELLASVLDTLCQEKMITCTNGIHRLN